ncbi:hypothetical protein D3C71_1767420 [compost metagenome]
MWIATASPNTSHAGSAVPSCASSCTIWVTTHSNCTGLAATRDGRTLAEGRVSSLANSNSSTCAGTIAAEAFIASASSRVARFHTNSPVSRALASESFAPSEQKPTIGGL